MRNCTPLLTLSVLAAGVIANSRFVAPGGTQAGAGVNTLGLSRTDAVAGDRVPVDAIGTGIAQSGAAIAANALIETDANGKAITHVSGVVVGRMAPGEVATAADQFIEVILLQN